MNNGVRKIKSSQLSVGTYTFLPIGNKNILGKSWIKSTEVIPRTAALTRKLYPLSPNDTYSGLVWTTQTSNFGTTGILSVAYGNNLWVAGGYYGQLRTSTDAVTWTTRTSNFGTSHISTVAYGNNIWVAGGDGGTLRTSTDAVTWTTRTSNFGTTNINTVAYGNNIWVAGGDVGQLRTIDHARILIQAPQVETPTGYEAWVKIR